MHPLYGHARGFVGQRVVVHAYGRAHHGVLHSVTPEGVYLNQTPMARPVNAGDEEGINAVLAPFDPVDGVEAESVFWPLLFLPFLAIAALAPFYWGW